MTFRPLLRSFIFSLFALALPLSAWAQNIMIGALVTSQVTKVYVKPGQTVQAGQKLMDLDDQRWTAKLKLMQANLQIAKIQQADAKIELEQALDLFDRTVSSRRTLDAAQLAYDLAEQKTLKAQAEYEMTKSWEKYFHITAPLKGIVVKIHAPLGSTVFQENTPLLEIK